MNTGGLDGWLASFDVLNAPSGEERAETTPSDEPDAECTTSICWQPKPLLDLLEHDVTSSTKGQDIAPSTGAEPATPWTYRPRSFSQTHLNGMDTANRKNRSLREEVTSSDFRDNQSSPADARQTKSLGAIECPSNGPTLRTRDTRGLLGEISGNERADSVLDQFARSTTASFDVDAVRLDRRCREERIRARKVRDLQRARESIDNLLGPSRDSFQIPHESTFSPWTSGSSDKRLSVFDTPTTSSEHQTGYTPITGQTLSPVMLVAEKVEVPRSRIVKKPIPLLLKEYSPSKPAAVAVRADSPPQSPGSATPVVTPDARKDDTKARVASSQLAPHRVKGVKEVRNFTGPSSISAPSAMAQRSSICSSHTSASKETRLEARLEALERENKLLEAALMAVLKTSGTLNKCPCMLARKNRLAVKRESTESALTDGSGLSALDVYLSTRHSQGKGVPPC